MRIPGFQSMQFLSFFFFSRLVFYVLVSEGRFRMVYSRLSPPLGGRGIATERIPFKTKLGAKPEPIKTN